MLNTKSIIAALVLLFSASSAFAAVTKPGAPQWVTATAAGLMATVTFSPPASNGGATITSYTVSCNPACTPSSSPTSPIRVSGLITGTAYTYTVTATNSAGTGVASAASNAAPICDGIQGTTSSGGYLGVSEVYSYKEAGSAGGLCDPASGCDGYIGTLLYTCSNLTGPSYWVTVATGTAHDSALVNLIYYLKQSGKKAQFWTKDVPSWGKVVIGAHPVY